MMYSEKEFILLDSTHPKLKTRREVNEIIEKIQYLGEYHYLFEQLNENPNCKIIMHCLIEVPVNIKSSHAVQHIDLHTTVLTIIGERHALY